MTTTTRADAGTLLPDDMMARFAERAPAYDRDNAFFEEDFAELRSSGYLDLAIPTDMGGSGATLEEYSRLARRLAYFAPATALAVNMHLYWTGMAADLRRAGDDSCAMILDRAAAGEVLAALHGEVGNENPLLVCTTTAERTEGGWRIDGHKIFGSLSPVWTLGGFAAMDSSDPQAPRIVHGFVRRDEPGVRVVDTWDTLGMRATQSQDTLLEKAFVPDEQVILVCPAGFAGAGPVQLGIFAWALLGFASVYLGAATRAYDLTLEGLAHKTSLQLSGSMAHHPGVQHAVSEMRMNLDLAEALLDRTAQDWSEGVAHLDWPVRLVGTRYTVIDRAYSIVDTALDLSGGGGAFKRNRLEQLFRDVRMGRFHPGNSLMAHELLGKLCLGLDPDASPRWG